MSAQAEARYEDLYGSAYLSPGDLKPDQTVKIEITGYEINELFCKGQKNVRCCLSVKGTKKRIAVNKTSAKVLAKAWGKDFSAWVGKTAVVRRGMVNNKDAILVSAE